jgi:hypothetical protein
MFARLAVALLLGSSSLALTQAAAQNRPIPAPRVSAPPHVSAPPRVTAPPPRITAPSHFHAPQRFSAPPHVTAPRFAPPPRISAPTRAAPRIGVQATPHVANPHRPLRSTTPASSRLSPTSGQTSAFTRTQTRALRREESVQVRQLQAKQRQQLRDLRKPGHHPESKVIRQIRSQHTQQLRDLRQQFRERRLGKPQVGGVRPDGRPRITRDVARQSRFTSHFLQRQHPPRWRADRIPAHHAWRRHHRAAFVAWTGPLFWPYVYTDLFYYPFWPDAYDDAYWPYVYDDFFDSIYWATGNPYSTYTYTAPTAAPAGRRPGASRNRNGDICSADAGITAWPFVRIENVLKPSPEQQALLDGLKTAATQAAGELKTSCPRVAALTPTGRLAAMLERLQATLNASRMVHAPLIKFYDSLSDEQKARFNAIGPDAGPKTTMTAATAGPNAACSGQKPGVTDLPVERIEDAIRPSDTQKAKLDALRKANGQALAVLQAACPDSVPQTPVGRFEAIEKRLEAMIQAGKAIQPALQEFYVSLTDEQKSRFNTLDQQAEK